MLKHYETITNLFIKRITTFFLKNSLRYYKNSHQIKEKIQIIMVSDIFKKCIVLFYEFNTKNNKNTYKVFTFLLFYGTI